MSQFYLFDIILVSDDVYGGQGDLLLVDVRKISVSDQSSRKEDGKLERRRTLQKCIPASCTSATRDARLNPLFPTPPSHQHRPQGSLYKHVRLPLIRPDDICFLIRSEWRATKSQEIEVRIE